MDYCLVEVWYPNFSLHIPVHSYRCRVIPNPERLSLWLKGWDKFSGFSQDLSEVCVGFCLICKLHFKNFILCFSLLQMSHLSSLLIPKNIILIQTNWLLYDHETSFISPERFNEASNRCFNDQERFFNGLNISFTAPDTYTKDLMRLFIYLY